MLEDDIWDEDEWESFLKENDDRIDRFMDLVFSFISKSPPPEFSDFDSQAQWKEQLRAYMREKGWENDEIDATIPIEFQFDTRPNDEGADQIVSIRPTDEDDLDEENIQDVPIYLNVHLLATNVLEWANALPVSIKDSTLVQFCNQIMLLPSNVAKGHSIGYDKETIGGNIACVKRALQCANTSLQLVSEMKHSPYMTPEVYRTLSERTYETRNALAIHVQELREQFHLGID